MYRYTCRGGGTCDGTQHAGFADTTPLASDRHSSIPVAGPCLEQHARACRRRMSGLYAFRCSVQTCTLAAVAARAIAGMLTSPQWRSGPAASLGTTHPSRSRWWCQRGQSPERRDRRSRGVCRNPRLAAPGAGYGVILPQWRLNRLAAVAARPPQSEHTRATCSNVPRQGQAPVPPGRCHRRQ